MSCKRTAARLSTKYSKSASANTTRRILQPSVRSALTKSETLASRRRASRRRQRLAVIRYRRARRLLSSRRWQSRTRPRACKPPVPCVSPQVFLSVHGTQVLSPWRLRTRARADHGNCGAIVDFFWPANMASRPHSPCRPQSAHARCE